jgi:tetratricopeptide (TPR) repeat protein
MTQNTRWHYSHNGQERGPVSFTVLQELARSGELHPEDAVTAEWGASEVPAREIPGLFDAGDEPGGSARPLAAAANSGMARAAGDSPVFGAMTLVVPSEQARSHGAAMGRSLPTIPGFRLVREIGRGGMGIVWEAVQLSLDRRVAIKALSAELSGGDDFVARFDREATALARLSHPNIVKVIDRGRAGDLCYFAMEYVEGAASGPPTDLRELMRGGHLDSTRTLQIASQICKGLASAHKQGVVHRDIKPSNVLIDANGDVRIVDFGIASISRASSGQAVHLTVAGTSVGTPAYMAPEQKIDAGNVDHRADVFSVGVLIYELLTGQLPCGSFERPSEIVPGLNPKWDSVVERATRPTVDRRFSGMDELLEQLAAISESHGAAPLPAGDERTPLPTPVPRLVLGRCPRCDRNAPTDRRYCPHCGLDLRQSCPKCGDEQPLWEDFCASCGTALAQLRKAAQWLVEGVDELKRAKDPGTRAIQRVEALEKAYLGVGRALKSSPENAEAAATLKEIESLRPVLATAAVGQAMQDRELGTASQLCRILLEDSPDNAQAIAYLKEIESMRVRMVEQSRLLRGQGNLKGSCRVLAEAIRFFPYDQEIRSLHKETENELGQLEATIKQQIPALRKARQYVQLARVLNEMSGRGVQIRGLPETSRQVEAVLERAQKSVIAARAGLSQGRYPDAQRLAREALELVTDLPDPEGILAEASAGIAKQEAVTASVEKAISAERWFTARGLLRRFLEARPNHSAAAKMLQRVEMELAGQVDSLRLLVFNIGGGAAWVAAGILSVLFCDTLRQAKPNISFGQISSKQCFGACAVSLHCILAGVLLLGLMNIWKRRINWRPIGWMTLAPLAALGAGVVPRFIPVAALGGILGPAMQDARGIADMLVSPSLAYASCGLLLAALLWAVMSEVGVGLACSWLLQGLICAGAWFSAESWPMESGRVSVGSFVVWLCVGWTCAAALGALGLARGWGRYLILPAAIMLCYGIRHAIGTADARDSSDWLPFVANVAVAGAVGGATQIVLGGRQRASRHILAGLLCAGVWLCGLHLDPRTDTWARYLMFWGLIWFAWADSLRHHLGTELPPRIRWTDWLNATLLAKTKRTVNA